MSIFGTTNGAYVIKQLTPSAARIYKDGVQLYAFSDSQPYQFTQAGEYEIRVYEGEAYDSLPLFVTEREAQPKVTAASIAGEPPKAEFDHFSVFEEFYESFQLPGYIFRRLPKDAAYRKRRPFGQHNLR